MDFKLTIPNEKPVFLEFDGPYHFVTSGYGIPKHPFRKKKIIEDKTGIEVINWAYWIQRCSRNLKAIFDNSVNGLGVLWGTKVHFGMFIAKDSSQVIKEITERFNATDENGIGYFYEPKSKNRNNPKHPIIDEIKNGKKEVDILLSKGFENRYFWLPKALKQN